MGSNEWDDPLERLSFNAAFSDWQTTQRNAFDDWVIDGLGVDPNNHAYQSYRTYTTLGIELGTLAWGGYGLAKGGFRAIRSSRWFLPKEGSKIASQIVTKEIKFIAEEGMALSRGAENVNAGINLNRKLSRLEYFQQNTTKTRVLPDGRIRYYDAEIISRTVGPTRGACNVLEWNPRTSNVRGWYECYDHFGNVNRVHPKNINGQVVLSPHYPKIGVEL